MAGVLLDALRSLELEGEIARREGLRGRWLTLRRAWPRSREQVLLEYVDAGRRIVPAQWMADPARLRRIRRQMLAAFPQHPPVLAQGTVLLHFRGVDRKLRGLAELLACPGSLLLTHRPERRAVVQQNGCSSSPPRFAKVLAPERAGIVADKCRTVAELAGRPFRVPSVVAQEAARGVITLSALPGQSLHEKIGEGDSVDALRSVGAALRWLHEAPAPRQADRHGPESETAVLQRWIGHVDTFVPELAPEVRDKACEVMDRLSDESSPAAVLHRDFHDKQVFIGADGGVGMLDLDLLALGEAALDVANMVGHLELRALQGWCGEHAAATGIDAFLEGYGLTAEVQRRVPAYLDSTRLRLACVYAFRPRWRSLCRALVERVGHRPGS